MGKILPVFSGTIITYNNKHLSTWPRSGPVDNNTGETKMNDYVNDVFKEGFLTTLAETKLRDEKVEKLSKDQIARIATILGYLSKDHDLFNLLFEQPTQRMTVDNVVVNTADLRMFVILDHKFTRGYFVSTRGPATSDTTYSQGVPLALEGAKRLYNKSYMSWLDGLDLSDKNSAIRCDIFLPAHLASLDINDNTGEVVQGKTYGLITLYANSIKFPIEVINQIREQVPNWLATHTPRMVDAKCIDDSFGTYYNKCAQKMRSLILQGWIWGAGNNVRNDSMITDISDWDNIAPDTSKSFLGYSPTDSGISPGLLKFMGSTVNEYKSFKDSIKEEDIKEPKEPPKDAKTNDDLTL